MNRPTDTIESQVVKVPATAVTVPGLASTAKDDESTMMVAGVPPTATRRSVNLLDEIHQHLATHGPCTRDDIATTLIDPTVIAPSKVGEDLHRLKTAGRASVTKQGVWSAID